MKNKLLLLLLPAIIFYGCGPAQNTSLPMDSAWSSQPSCTLRLVAYRTSKSSKYYMEEVETGALFYMNSLGGRRIPTIPLGGTIQSRCGYSKDGKRITEFYNYRTSIVKHTTGTVVRSLSGYDHLFIY